MADWHELVKFGRFDEAEAAMLAETEPMDQYGENTVTRAGFYEAWGDSLGSSADAATKYDTSAGWWGLFASWSTSGGEGSARMMDVNRVLAKIEALKGS